MWFINMDSGFYKTNSFLRSTFLSWYPFVSKTSAYHEFKVKTMTAWLTIARRDFVWRIELLKESALFVSP